MKSSRNKTIDIPLAEGQHFLQRCVFPKPAQNLGDVSAITDKIICGDTMKTAPLLPHGFADLIIADPPYNMDKDFHGEKFKHMSAQQYAQYTRDWINAVLPLMSENASIYVCCDWESSLVVGNVLAEFFTVRNRITWQREKGRGSERNWKNGMEDIWFATLTDKYCFNANAVKQRRRVIAPYRKGGKPKDWEQTENGNWRNTYASNFWDDISIPYWSMAENTPHPTQKPEKLTAKLILASSNEGDMIFDPFCGSGTTAVTAKKLGRHFCAIERSEQYCVWAQKRLEMAEDDHSIQGYTNGVFWERNSADAQRRCNIN